MSTKRLVIAYNRVVAGAQSTLSSAKHFHGARIITSFTPGADLASKFRGRFQ